MSLGQPVSPWPEPGCSGLTRSDYSLLDVMYWAGLFEGEGSVTVHGSKGRSQHMSYCLEVIVTMCDPEPLERLMDFWGGRWFVHDRSSKGWRPLYRWMISARQAAAFLGAIRPYLQSVRLQTKVDLALAFQAQKGRPGRVTDEYRERQRQFKDAMLLLNGSGDKALTPEERLEVVAGVV